MSFFSIAGSLDYVSHVQQRSQIPVFLHKHSLKPFGIIVFHFFFLPTLPYLNRLCISKDKNMQHVHVWVFLEYVGLGMVLEVTMVPPVGRGTLGRYRELIHAKAQLL